LFAVRATYRYFGPSEIVTGKSDERVRLATSGGAAEHPILFSGFLTRPRLAAGLLLAVSKVAATRFYTPVATTNALVRAADPVVTSDGQQLRFESFSACTGVYARADLLGDAIDDGFLGAGTTNVDFNPPMRAALARVGGTTAAHLSVGLDEVSLSTLRETVTERKVDLPDRWLRGFAEVQLVQAGMVPRVEMQAIATKRFLSTLARTHRRGLWWAVPARGTLELAQAPAPGAIRIAGLERLWLLADHARHATGLRVWTSDRDDAPACAWELDLPGARLTLVLSPEVNRGFSGEGNVLRDVADEAVVRAADALRPLVRGQRAISTADLASGSGLETTVVRRSLNVLASAGCVGYELAGGHFFHRELPFEPEAMAVLHPRLRGALALGAGAVAILERSEGSVLAAVRGVNATYIVRSSGGVEACTCAWYREHGTNRGPCKHVLALGIAGSGPRRESI
jgi:hypothetical protein